MRRFAPPPAPEGWEGARSELVRIIDPLGLTVAWFAPGLTGACVGWAVRESEQWSHVLRAPMADAVDETCAVTLRSGGSVEIVHGWELESRDPTGCTLRTASGGVNAQLTAELDEGELHLRLEATRTDSHGGYVGMRVRRTESTEPDIVASGATADISGAQVTLAGEELGFLTCRLGVTYRADVSYQ